MVNTHIVITYRLCLRCYRAVPVISHEHFCINDGTKLLEACPKCKAPITSPYARHCGACGCGFTDDAKPQFERKP